MVDKLINLNLKNMSELTKKTILAGIGILSLGREKARKIAKDLIKRGELAKASEEKFVKDLIGQAKKSKDEMEKTVEKLLRKELIKLNIPTRKEVNTLKEKVNKLTKQAKK